MAETGVPPSRPLEPQKRAIVVGASSGIGAALVAALAQDGYAVGALARREARLSDLKDRLRLEVPGSNLRTYCHNVLDTDEIAALFRDVVRDLGGLDLIIYSAGVQPPTARDEYDLAKDEMMIRVNTLGAVAWLGQAALRFSRLGQGHIVGISSVAGDRGRIPNPAYHASKSGLSTYLESLRNRLTRLGVTVTTVKPGYVQTDLLEAAGGGAFWVISPEVAARQIVRAIRRHRQVVYVPGRWRLVMLIIRHIPSVLFRRLNF